MTGGVGNAQGIGAAPKVATAGSVADEEAGATAEQRKARWPLAAMRPKI